MNLNEYVLANHQTALELLRTLCLIPSPSHHEEKRAAFCKAWLMDHGAENAFIDEAKNVIYEYNAENDVPVAIFMAHIDTVFPESVPLELTEKDGRWFCPAVGDDTANVALLMLMAAYVANEKPKTNGGIVFVMNSCEEGLGNLKGSRALNARYGKRIEQVISFDGYLDGIVGMAVGSLRYKVTVKTTGGHSFADFGNVNAIERLSAIITELYQYKIPAGSAKTTFNVGTISGGTTVNSIAAQAEMLYEMRSDDYACLMDAKAYFEKILEEFKAEGVDVTAELLGERPCGNKENHDPRQTALLTQCADAVENHFGTRPGVYAGSTDCNIPLANGIPAAAIGLCIGAGVFLSVFDRAAVVTLAEEESRASLRVVSEVGARLPVYCTSQGKLFLANSSPAECRRILTHTELKAFTPHTLTTPEQFVPELTRIREQGYAVENGEYKIGLRSVSAPIHDVTGEVRYAIGCVGMFRQVQSDEFLRAIRLVCAAAETISRAIGYHG